MLTDDMFTHFPTEWPAKLFHTKSEDAEHTSKTAITEPHILDPQTRPKKEFCYVCMRRFRDKAHLLDHEKRSFRHYQNSSIVK